MPRKQQINPEEETSLRIKVPSITLNKESIRTLWKIVEQAKDTGESDIKLHISGDKEFVNTQNIDKLINARWPSNVQIVDLLAVSEKKAIDVIFENHPMGANRIEISSNDSDWVTARSKEITDFINEHKSWHWIFYSVPMLMIMVFIFAILGWLSVAVHYGWSFDKGIIGGMVGLMVGAFSTQGLMWAYPYINVESGTGSPKKTIRTILNYLFPAIGLGIVMNIIWTLWI